MPASASSRSGPLRIDSVDAPGGGTIGMTLCPGRTGPSRVGDYWNRDLAADLAAVRAWHPDIAISLLEDHEYAMNGVPAFREDVAKAGLPWRYAPIPDGGTPGRPFREAWQTLGPDVRRVLQSGGRVLVHCNGGLGRTGVVVSMVLIDLGMASAEAMRAVRAARPDTVEPAQVPFVLAYPAPAPTTS